MGKRLLIIAVLAISCSAGSPCHAAETDAVSYDNTFRVDEEEEKIEIKIIEIKKIPRTRSGASAVYANLIPDLSQVELFFNQNIGIVEVTVSGPSGISSMTCDTQDTYFTTIPVGSVPGFYRIDIIGPEYEGTGSFWL